MSLTEQEILEGNKLIAEFLGIEKKIYGETGITYYIDNIPYQLFKLKYHSSWDWLMNIVEKCESIKVCNKGGFAFIITGTMCQWDSVTYIGKTKIEAVWKAVVEFIKFYNNNLV